jgi:hypothetical protein
MSFSMVRKTWDHVLYRWISYMSNVRNLGSQIEIFSLIRIIANVRRCLQSNNLHKLIFVSTNMPNDSTNDHKSPFSLIELIEIDANLEKSWRTPKDLSKLKGMRLWIYKIWMKTLLFQLSHQILIYFYFSTWSLIFFIYNELKIWYVGEPAE